MPTSAEHCTSAPIDTLDDARSEALSRDLQLEVDDWTYDLLVSENRAPAVRPADVPRPAGAGLSPGLPIDEREGALSVAREACALVGLPLEDARAAAAARKMTIRFPDGHPVTADFCATRVNLVVEDGVVTGVALG